jgi:hypothetical protein
MLDGFGQRRVAMRADGTTAVTLRVSPALAGEPVFCRAVQERAVALGGRDHRGLARVLGVQVPSGADPSLLIDEEWSCGERLGALVDRRAGEQRPLTLGHALFVAQGAVAALRTLHGVSQGPCHGALSLDSFVLVEPARLILHDVLLGAGLAALSWPAAQIRDVLGVEVPEVAGIPAFTPLTDQFQLGRLLLELLSPARGPRGANPVDSRLTEMTVVGTDGRSRPASDDLRVLLARMLLISKEGPYRSFAALERAIGEVVAADPDHEPTAPTPVTSQPPDQPVAGPLRVVVAAPGVTAPSLPVSLTTAGEPKTAPHAIPAELLRDGTTGEPVPAMPLGGAALRVAGAPAGSPPPPLDLARGAELRSIDVRAVLPAERDRLTGDASFAPSSPPAPVWTPPLAPPAFPVADRASADPAEDRPTPRQRPQRQPTLPAADAADGFDVGLLDTFQGWERQAAVPATDSAARFARAPSRWWWLVVAVIVLGGLIYALMVLSSPTVPAHGYLRLESKPGGATVTVDGVPRGVTPLTLSVPAGSYRVDFTLGSESRTLTVPVKVDQEAYQLVSLYPPGPPGTLVVDSAPAGANVIVDGQVRGQTPIEFSDVVPGEHTVAVESGIARVERVIEVMAGARVDVVVPLSGSLLVVAPFEVEVSDGARMVGKSSAGRLAVPAGQRTLTFANEGLNYAETRDVDVEAGGLARVVLTPPTGVINFSADAPAEVFLDGRPLGPTPLPNVAVSLGTHEVLFSHPRLGEVRYTVLVALGPAYRLHATLQTQVRVRQPPVRSRR